MMNQHNQKGRGKESVTTRQFCSVVLHKYLIMTPVVEYQFCVYEIRIIFA